MYRFSDDAGYTLLELLIVVAILAMISVPLGSGIRLGLYQWRKNNERIHAIEHDMLVRERLRIWLAHAYPFDTGRSKDKLLYPLEGTSEEVTFVTPTGPDPRANALQRISLAIEGSQLKANMVPDAVSYHDNAPTSKATLLDGIETFSVAYLDTRTDPNSPVWTSEWSGQRKLPGAVRVRVTFTDSKRVWPDLITPFPIEQWSFCNYDGTGNRCRSGENAG